MKAKIVATIFIFGLTVLMIKAQDKKASGLIKETGQRVSIIKGNELYGWCEIAQKTFTPDGEGKLKFSGSRDEDHAATSCRAYIEGVVDCTPTGDEFNPSSDVRLSQYIDVVVAYLKVHANIRNQPAAWLVQNAIRESFSRP